MLTTGSKVLVRNVKVPKYACTIVIKDHVNHVVDRRFVLMDVAVTVVGCVHKCNASMCADVALRIASSD